MILSKWRFRIGTMKRYLVTYLIVLIVFVGCSDDLAKMELGHEIDFRPITFSNLPGWMEDDLSKALLPLSRSCKTLLKKHRENWFNGKQFAGRVRDWIPACNSIPKNESANETSRAYFKKWFQAYEVFSHGVSRGLFTGYFEPNLQGSLEEYGEFTVPIYNRPNDLILVTLADWDPSYRGKRIAGRIIEGRLKPYPSRSQITAGALGEKAKPIAWTNSVIDAFFLHVQGSGRITLRDGSFLRVGYSGHNGHKYYPIGRYLLKKGELDKSEISLQSIREWLIQNPDRLKEVLNQNASYIFFRQLKGEGPIGSQGVPLTPGRSLAIDRSFLPLGAPIWVSIDFEDERGLQFSKMMVTQDTGGAIKGPLRGDVFWGFGKKAEKFAGPMNAKGKYYLLLPKSVAVP